jgi:hypothetical protein
MIKWALPVVAAFACSHLPNGTAAATTLTQCPAEILKGATYTGCNFLISENPGDTFVTSTDDNQPFFSGEDSFVGFQNNTNHPVTAITLDGGVDDLFAFDDDGPASNSTSATFCATGNAGLTGYEGPDNTFSHINSTCTVGEIDFTAAILPGGSTYFFMEGLIDPSIPPVGGPPATPTPEPASIFILATVLAIFRASSRAFSLAGVRARDLSPDR